ncbi:DUF1653 domain-containing protein [Candidatus Woesearchaeota archaeon]|nr:DUF1653 domain-containing protein [Nanoarchaeota archaeon]MCB9370747.1 DUF1653 domain-containing protein [Candidatus Woesearchaeota archaeon]USN43822.1 MAG: DUF1653 domain-containing protein [Candidatus Woesearchaeota archaeon]
MKFQLGLYRHSKSAQIYEVIAVARDSETLEEIVVYRGLYFDKDFGNQPVWTRPLSDFCKTVIIGGKELPRFDYLREKN